MDGWMDEWMNEWINEWMNEKEIYIARSKAYTNVCLVYRAYLLYKHVFHRFLLIKKLMNAVTVWNDEIASG